MNKVLLLFATFTLCCNISAQIDCEVGDCACILNKAQSAFDTKSYDKAIALFQAYKICRLEVADFADSMVLLVFKTIEREKLRAYANDLAYKSLIALQHGDRTSAFRLAEFAHRYVDDDNLHVTRALVDALYYNDDLAHSPLPWASNLEGHANNVLSVAFSPVCPEDPRGGKHLATGSGDNTVKIWDLQSGNEILTLEGHLNWVNCVAFSPDGKRLATGSMDNTAKIWDLQSGNIILTLEGHTESVFSVAFSPDGKRLATGSRDNTAKIWDLQNGEVTITLKGHKNLVRSVTFSPDGKHLATGADDNTAKIWDLDNGKDTMTLEGYKEKVFCVAFSPNGEHLAMGTYDKVKIWDLQSRDVTITLDGHTNWVSSIAFSSDGKRLVTGAYDNTAKIWDLKSGKMTMTLEGHSNWVRSVTFSPDGKHLATGSDDKTAKIWDLQSGQSAMVLQDHSGGVISVAFSPDGKHLATGYSHEAKIWNLQSGRVAKTLKGHTNWVRSVAFSFDGKRLATGADDKTAKIWDLQSGKVTMTLEGHLGLVSSVAFSPDGKHLATGSADKTAKIWDLQSGEATMTCKGHLGLVSSVAFSPDGKCLATGASDNTAKVWDLQSGNTTMTLHGHSNWVSSVAFSPDGKHLATGSADKTAKIWDLDIAKDAMTLEGHSYEVWSVAFSSDGKRLATGSKDKTAMIWDLDSGKDVLTLKGHFSNVYSVALSPDGKRLATGSDDKTAKIWEITPQGCLTAIRREKRLSGLSTLQLSNFSLETLLDQITSNEDSLLAQSNVWQIAAFAELYGQKTRNSRDLRRTASDYARSIRLFHACVNLSKDSVFLTPLGSLYHRWASDILESGRPDTAAKYIELSCRWNINKSICPDLWQRFFEKTGKDFDLNLFLASDNSKELRGYGDYFFMKEKWNEAGLLYEKAEDKEHSAYVLVNLFLIAEKTGNAFDFNRFFVSENPREIGAYALIFIRKTGGKEEKSQIPYYQNALRIREQQMKLDTSAVLRLTVSKEYNNLGWSQIFAREGKGAELSLQRAAELNPYNIYVPTNVPLALLLQGRQEAAKVHYLEWADRSFSEQGLATYRDAFLSDLKTLEEAGVKDIDYNTIRHWLKN